MHVLRAEKGYVILGQETEGTVTPDDLGLGWAVGKAKRDFIGKRSLARPEMRRSDRPQLVGLAPRDGGRTVPEEGAQLIARPGSAEPLGHVTSAYASAALGRPIALGLLAGGRARLGETVFATRLDGAPVALEVASPVFYDPEGERLHG
jgi:sarcosine oxidase subunit alpha